MVLKSGTRSETVQRDQQKKGDNIIIIIIIITIIIVTAKLCDDDIIFYGFARNHPDEPTHGETVVAEEVADGQIEYNIIVGG